MDTTPQEGIVKSILALINEGKPISLDYKIKFRDCLEWIIKNEKDNEKLAWAYNLRGMVRMGAIPEVCE